MEWIGEATVGLFPRFPSLSLGQVLFFFFCLFVSFLSFSFRF